MIDNDAYVRAVHDKGLRSDLRTMSRRRMLTALGGAFVVLGSGCSAAEPGSASPSR